MMDKEDLKKLMFDNLNGSPKEREEVEKNLDLVYNTVADLRGYCEKLEKISEELASQIRNSQNPSTPGGQAVRYPIGRRVGLSNGMENRPPRIVEGNNFSIEDRAFMSARNNERAAIINAASDRDDIGGQSNPEEDLPF